MTAVVDDVVTMPSPERTASIVAAVADNGWIPLEPPVLRHRRCRLILRRCARQLEQAQDSGTVAADTIAGIRSDATRRAATIRARVAVPLIACIHVLCDLRSQGWQFRVNRSTIAARAPLPDTSSVDEEKARVRAAHLIERDAQLSQPATRRFIRALERPRLVGADWKSVLSLVRDGRELAAGLRRLLDLRTEEERIQGLAELVDPYVQVVRPGSVCAFTGLRLSDIWRYFRHTWITTYQSTPGRKLFFLIRDRAAPNHPVVGIGALGSTIVQLSVRDAWVGWTAEEFVGLLRSDPSARWTRWIQESLASLVASISVADFIREGVLSRTEIDAPTTGAIKRLRAFAKEERRIHRVFPDRAQHKRAQLAVEAGSDVNWQRQAGTHLFRSKRAASLAELLDARLKLEKARLVRGSSRRLSDALENRDTVTAIHTVLRSMKAARVGVSMMDITVCGAIAPYNELLGGKLVSLLMASPDVVTAYRERYTAAPSVIASSMAGKAVCRRPQLVLLGTTSLYGVGASQYNRIRVPAAIAGGSPGGTLAFIPLGRTVGYGSYHFSRDTMAAIDVVLRRQSRGRPVNSIFGEGVNPKLRKVRGGLDAIGLPSDLLLQHGSPRLVYAVPLAENFREILLGRRRRPTYILPQRPEATRRLAGYWRTRWLRQRIEQPGIIDRVATHSLAHPIRHGARVVLPVLPEEIGPLFAAISTRV